LQNELSGKNDKISIVLKNDEDLTDESIILKDNVLFIIDKSKEEQFDKSYYSKRNKKNIDDLDKYFNRTINLEEIDLIKYNSRSSGAVRGFLGGLLYGAIASKLYYDRNFTKIIAGGGTILLASVAGTLAGFVNGYQSDYSFYEHDDIFRYKKRRQLIRVTTIVIDNITRYPNEFRYVSKSVI